MYHPPSKRNQFIRRTIIYTAMTTAVISIVAGILLLLVGYDFNRKAGQIEQGGLIQFASVPSGATIKIDGNELTGRTPTKSQAFAGDHNVTMDKIGYNSWQKSINLVAGTILWLDYARLIPTELKPEPVINFTNLSSTLPSVDSKQLAIIENQSIPNIHIVNVDDEKTPLSTVVLPIDSYSPNLSGEKQSFSLESWDNSGRYIIVKHKYDLNKTEWIILDSKDISKTKNITSLLAIDISTIVFDKSNNRIVFVQTGNDIRSVDLNADTLSRVLVSNVEKFNLSESSVINYVTTIDQEKNIRSVGYYQTGSEKPVIVRSYDDSVIPLNISTGNYFNNDYIAINHGQDIDLFRLNLPKDSAEAANIESFKNFDIVGGSEWLSFGNKGRFVIAQNGNIYTVHDLELDKTTTTELKGASVNSKKISWLDNYILWNDSDSMARIYEFDGANQRDIMPVTPGFSALITPHGDFLSAFKKTDTGVYQLQRVKLKI